MPPRPELKSRVLAAATGGEAAPRPAMFTRLFWSAAAAAAVIALFVSLFSDFGYETDSLRAGEGFAPAYGKVLWKGTALRFSAGNLPSLEAGKEYELWRIRAGVPDPAGMYLPNTDGLVSATHSLKDPTLPGDVFALTIEPKGGVRKPTGPMILIPAPQ